MSSRFTATTKALETYTTPLNNCALNIEADLYESGQALRVPVKRLVSFALNR
ncbi:hypothetical protein [Vibrio sp. VPAP30]|uniref:hypothetical protein n=1 Tax=Vibrio sp. VPAP30 TaxID=1647102 RepID=UPI000B2C2D1B|nr:hypothetical protein [Vibrio sp. VPAP30]